MSWQEECLVERNDRLVDPKKEEGPSVDEPHQHDTLEASLVQCSSDIQMDAPSSVNVPPLIATPPIPSSHQKKSRSGRHGARNQDRHKCFTKWLLETFPHIHQHRHHHGQQLQHHVDDNDHHNPQPQSRHILDIAGGKGELAARLSMCHQLHVVLVDPRPAAVATCFQQRVLPKLPQKWQQRIQQQPPNFCHDCIQERVSQLTMSFDSDTIRSCVELQTAIQQASLLVGMHADGATEAIVDAALQYGKAFCVVPCCVFPRLFAQRFLKPTVHSEDGAQNAVAVRTHAQFCQYLLQKDERLVQETLPFEGRNTAIWWDGT